MAEKSETSDELLCRRVVVVASDNLQGGFRLITWCSPRNALVNLRVITKAGAEGKHDPKDLCMTSISFSPPGGICERALRVEDLQPKLTHNAGRSMAQPNGLQNLEEGARIGRGLLHE